MHIPHLPFSGRAAQAALALAMSLALNPAAVAEAQPTALNAALPDPVPPPPQTVLFPASEERIAAAIATLDDLAQQMLARSGIPGLAIAVVHRGQTVYARGFGLRAVGQPAPVDADTVFLLASLSKPVGATVVATQVSAGTVGWDSPVQPLLPWFGLGDPWVSQHVTIGDLYAHRSGLPDHAGDDLEDLGYDRRTVLERLAQLPQHAFRAHYAYTNFGLTAAAEAVAVAAGQDWASLSERALYAPLDMGATSSRHADYMARANRAASHTPGPDGYVAADLRQPDGQSPAGGVSSSVNDMARWMTMVLSGGMAGDTRLIAEQALRPALSPQMIDGLPMSVEARSSSYGYGFGVGVRPSGRVVISHSGAFALGASTTFALIPGLDLGIVVLTNAPPTGVAESIAGHFTDRAELGVDSRDWLAAYGPRMAALSAPTGSLVGAEPPADPAPAQDSAAYPGHYDNGYFGAAQVESGDDGLILRLGPEGRALALQHWDGDRFVIHPLTENEPSGSVSRVDFAVGADGRATALTIEHLDHAGLGRFQRRE
ncbi:MAG: serine hydrolase [Pseudodonghicola sp.]